MKIKSVRLAWFRSAAEAVTLAAECKPVSIYGANGAGKPSFVDCIEYAIKSGRIEHLVSEYSGRNQEKAILNTHTPEHCNTEFWIKFQDDSELNVQIARNGTHRQTGAEGIAIQDWDYRRKVLRQDEVANFIRSSKGEKYSTLLPLLGLHELEVAAENLRRLARTIEQQSRLAEKQTALEPIRVRRQNVFADDTDEDIEAKIAELYRAHCPTGQASTTLDRCWELEAAVVTRIGALAKENQRYWALLSIAELNISSSIKAVRVTNAKLAATFEPLVTERLSVLQSADEFAAKLGNQGEVQCPACGELVTIASFKSHVKDEQERLVKLSPSLTNGAQLCVFRRGIRTPFSG